MGIAVGSTADSTLAAAVGDAVGDNSSSVVGLEGPAVVGPALGFAVDCTVGSGSAVGSSVCTTGE